MDTNESETEENEEEIAAATLLLCSSYLLLTTEDEDGNKHESSQHRCVWVRNWLKKRETEGAWAKLLKELCSGDSGERKLFQDFLRMSPAEFEELLQLVKPLIEKENTKFRTAISAGERLALTLHYLATGQSFRSLQFVFRLPQNTISQIIPLVLDALWSVLKDSYVRVIISSYSNCFGSSNNISML